MSDLVNKLNAAGVQVSQVKRTTPVWDGPGGSGSNGGVTQSLLSRWLSCRERFRLYAMEGLRPVDDWSHRLGYGSMWHVCEEAHAANRSWKHALSGYVKEECGRYRQQQEQIIHWYNVCAVQFPLYVDYWRDHKDVVNRTPLLQEAVFDVPYQLPSGRLVRLRGRWDSVDLIKDGNDTGIYLVDNKTKGDVNESQLVRQLTWDLQVMFYLVALQSYNWKEGVRVEQLAYTKYPIRGVRYNVVRRPLSGGAGSIRQHKPTKANPLGETREQFYDRLDGLIAEAPATYFFRWLVTVTPADVARFQRECLDPLLEQLCDWWECMTTCSGEPFEFCRKHRSVLWRHPFGVRNPMDDGGSSDLDNYLASGSETGLTRTDELFRELR